MIRSFVLSLIVVGVIVGGVTIVSAQSRAQPALQEVTLTGRVTGVIGHPDAEGTVGVHMDVETATGIVSVHLGPAMFIGMNNFSFIVGDQVEVVGSRAGGPETAVVARLIKTADRTLTLRDETGAPVWEPALDGIDGCGVTHPVANAGSGE